MLRKMRILVVEDEICQQARLTRSLSDCLSGRREKKLTVHLDRQGATSIRHWLKSALRRTLTVAMHNTRKGGLNWFLSCVCVVGFHSRNQHRAAGRRDRSDRPARLYKGQFGLVVPN
jgi:hypothetical protein